MELQSLRPVASKYISSFHDRDRRPKAELTCRALVLSETDAEFTEALREKYPGTEMPPTVSALTYYCEQNGVEHINIMQGERLLGIKSSFFRFHRCYVWDEHYSNLFKKLRADEPQFVVYVSQMLLIDLEKNRKVDKVVDFTYYLALFNEEQISNIAGLVEKIENAGYSIRLRPHLRWSDMELLEKYIKQDNIENIQEFSIQESIASSNAAISVSSTVLLQSIISGRKVFMDDIVFKERIQVLENRDYIVCKKDHNKLSDLEFLTNGIMLN